MKDQYFIEINGEETYHLGSEDDYDTFKDVIADYINPYIESLHSEKSKEVNIRFFIKELTDEQVEEICDE